MSETVTYTINIKFQFHFGTIDSLGANNERPEVIISISIPLWYD